MPEWRKLLAFAARDWHLRSSYHLSLLGTVGQMIFTLAMFFFIGRLVDPLRLQGMDSAAGDYFPFVVIGLVTAHYFNAGLSGLSGSLRDEQLQGTLESMLVTPTRGATVLIGGLIWELCWATLEAGLYLALGAVIFGGDFSRINVPATMVLLTLSMVVFSSLGVLSACGLLLFKEFDPVSWAVGGVMKLLGGVYFPIALLPDGLQSLARALPMAPILDGLRAAMLSNASLEQVRTACGIAVVFAAILWPSSLACFGWTLRRLKTAGALSFR
jgi:ABC-2 type transport system permease protein